MASLSDSKAHFLARAQEYAVPDDLIDNLKVAGISTMAHLAFAFVRPGQEFEEAKFDQWVREVNLGNAPTLGALAALRRLHFESEIIVTATLRSSVEHPQEASTPKPLPFAERTSRMAAIRRQFPGLSMEGMHEPSQALLEECTHQFDSRVLRYVEPAKCNSRELEVSVGKSDKKLRIESSTLSIKESKHTPDEDTSTAYKLLNCMKRRAIAYEFAGLISYEVHERYIDKMMRRLNAEPPPNYQQTSIAQILKADREVWVVMSQTVSDIRPDANGLKPLDKAIHEALMDYNVTFHMLPLPQTSASAYAPVRHREDQQRDQGSGWRDSGYKGNQASRKGKGKNKGGGGSSFAPRGIQGAVGRDAKGRPICFNYNLSECPDAAAGAACKKGRHVCFKANCFKPHQFSVAHPNEMPKGVS